MPGIINSKKSKWFVGDKKVKKGYVGNQKVYSSGNIVTYKVTSSLSYQEEVDCDASCLTPKTFTPTLSGWTFVGWKEDSTAYASVLSSKIMDDEPITLYALFRQAVTVTYYNGNTTKQTITGYRYYNNGNIINPSFTLSQVALSGWTARGWSTGTTGNSGITYNNATAFVRDSNITLYGMYYQTITCSFVSNGTKTASGTRYYNSNGQVVNASVTAPVGGTYSGWTWRGWAAAGVTTANAGVAYANGAVISGLTANRTYYGLHYQTITLSYSGNENTSGSTAAQTGTRYYNAANVFLNPTFTLRTNGFAKTNCVFNGWAMGSASGTVYAAGATVTLTSNTTFYVSWLQSVYTIPYTGNVYHFIVPRSGTYQLEVWGAQGGGAKGGKGGYSVGRTYLTVNTNLYICVGGQGGETDFEYSSGRTEINGGYNGGGTAGTFNNGVQIKAASGGGCTSICVHNNRGELRNYVSYTHEVLIVAGGGGGAGYGGSGSGGNKRGYGGSGGGLEGGDVDSWSGNAGLGGTQTSAGSLGGFGYGGGDYSRSGGGGGWYGGGHGGSPEETDYPMGDDEYECWPVGGGGGSGYTGSLSNADTTNDIQSGNGYAVITLVA